METGPSRGNSRGERPRRGAMVKCRGWRLAKALFEDLYFIQRTQKSHRKYWDRSMIRCHTEERLGARGVKAGDLHADSPPSVFPPPQVGTAPYVPIRKGGGTSPVLLPSSSTEPDSHVCTQAQSKTCWREPLLGEGQRWLGGGRHRAICPSRAGREEVWRLHAWVKLQSGEPLRVTWHSNTLVH